MKKLSPAAQAVLDAINKELDEAPWDLTFIAGSAAAAVLRAAALHLHAEEYETCGGCSYSLMVEVDDLLAIANELEAQ